MAHSHLAGGACAPQRLDRHDRRLLAPPRCAFIEPCFGAAGSHSNGAAGDMRAASKRDLAAGAARCKVPNYEGRHPVRELPTAARWSSRPNVCRRRGEHPRQYGRELRLLRELRPAAAQRLGRRSSGTTDPIVDIRRDLRGHVIAKEGERPGFAGAQVNADRSPQVTAE